LLKLALVSVDKGGEPGFHSALGLVPLPKATLEEEPQLFASPRPRLPPQSRASPKWLPNMGTQVSFSVGEWCRRIVRAPRRASKGRGKG
jgi:hypothetical protein